MWWVFPILLTAKRAWRHAHYFFGKCAQRHSCLPATRSWIFWNKEKRWKKGKYVNSPLNMLCLKCICSLHCSSITIDSFFLTLNYLYSMLKIILISVLLIFVYQMHIFFCFFHNYLKSHTLSSMSLPINMLIRQQHAYCFFCCFAQQHSYSANTFIWQSRVCNQRWLKYLS